MLLDCCFSGAALQGAMSAAEEALRASIDIVAQARREAAGPYVMRASASTALALARAGAKYTAFTGEIIVRDVTPIIFAHLAFDGIGDLLTAFRELEWDNGLKIFCAPAMAMSFDEARTAYAELMQAARHTEARLLIAKLAFFRRPSDLPLLK